MQELIQQWEEVYPDSFAEAELMGREKGIEQGVRQTQMAIAERMVRAGRPDQEIEQFTNITPEQIAQLRL